jgi:hypothetical protein
VPVAFRYFAVAVDFFRKRTWHNPGWPGAEAHTGTFVANALLLFQ